MFPRLSTLAAFRLLVDAAARGEHQAVLQLIHGISEHSGRYDRFAHLLAGNGFRAYASDLWGHGLSVPQSELGKASAHFWADTTADMKQLLDLRHTENPNLTRFALVTASDPRSRSRTSRTGQCVQRRHIVWHVWSVLRDERRSLLRALCTCSAHGARDPGERAYGRAPCRVKL